MTFTVENLEFFLAIAMRISGFVFLAPFFSHTSMPQRAKLLLSFSVALIASFVVPYEEPLQYNGVIGYAGLILSEAIAGMVLGLFANLAMFILSFAGQIADMEIGLSMVTQFDMSNNMQVTITSNIFTYAILLTMVATNMHLYILRAIIDSFVLIPVGHVRLSPLFYQGYLGYIFDYMVLAFRIILPVFAALLVVNCILAVLAKAAPQMNMFVIGFQLKIFVGLAVLTVMMLFLPSISELIFEKMMELMRTAAAYMTP
ncbi:MAG: flagellar biosynthetic protein FliR [Lachnospiraceae bacterium]|nr:flagellar biosynthetic protein FliR [Lachnospiraceae bacterium]